MTSKLSIEHSQHYNHGGFTLVEVMIAIFIIGFGLVAILGMFSSGLAFSDRTEEIQMTSILERDAIDQVELLHRLPSGALALTYDDSGRPRENYFYYADPGGGERPGYYCCYTMLPLENSLDLAEEDDPHPELRPEFSGSFDQFLTRGTAVVTMRFIRENPGNTIDPRDKPRWDDRIPDGQYIGKIRIFYMTAGGR